MKNHTSLRRKKRGFSLVELLAVIVVIGVVAGVAIANMSNVNENSRIVTAKRNAQQIASVFGAGQVTGAAGFATASSVATAMDAVGVGSHGGGINSSSFFQVAGTSATMDDARPEVERASHYLEWSDGNLIYMGDGSSAPPPPAPTGEMWQQVSAFTADFQQAQAWAAHFSQFGSWPTRISGQSPQYYVEQYF